MMRKSQQSIVKPVPFNKSYTFTKQTGVVLFVALVALVVMSLTAVSLIRSVDSNNMITGNLSLKQVATSSADAGVEAGLAQISTMVTTSNADPLADANHPVNQTDLATYPGFHASMAIPAVPANLASNVKIDGWWDGANNNSRLVSASDSVGNEVRYIVQRMCSGVGLSKSPNDCVYNLGESSQNAGGRNVGGGHGGIGACPTCAPSGQTPIYRITVRVKDYKDSTTYVQTFVH